MDTTTKESKLINLVIDEFNTSQSGRAVEFADFESVVYMLEGNRGARGYEWMSNISTLELASIILTDTSGQVNQYFQTRDFVEAKVDATTPEAHNIAKAATRCINGTLNRRELYYFAKYVRSRTINALHGHTYMLCEWKKDIRHAHVGFKNKMTPLNVDIYGNELTGHPDQQQAYRTEQEPVYQKHILQDDFNCEVIDPRNVATDNRYTYSLQEKDWVTIRHESTLEELNKQKDYLGLINLDQFDEDKKKPGDAQTETSKESYGKLEPDVISNQTPSKKMDIYLRIGKVWAIVKLRDKNNFPTKIETPYDDSGNMKDGAELVDAFVTVAIRDSKQVLIRFQPNPYRDARGKPYKPIIRGWCYVHPTKDSGLSDGKYGRELQNAMDDTINMSIDRVQLATLPTFIGRKLALDDTSEFFIEPEHVIQVDDPNNDLKELKISDNTQGALNQLSLLKNFSEQVMSVYPTTMGQLPSASNTATAIAGATQQGNLRSNYKSLTIENTLLSEQYWMIIQMTYQFAEPETAQRLMGDMAQFFSPDEDYTYTPVSSNVEQAENKFRKLQIIDQFFGRASGIKNENTPRLLNYLLGLAFELFDKEFPDYKKHLLNEQSTQHLDGGQPNQIPDMGQQPTSNQTGNPMSMGEMGARNNMMTGGGQIG